MESECILLGDAQDAGVPQVGCACVNCRQAITDSKYRRFVVSLGIVDYPSRQFWIIDATPDFKEQFTCLQTGYPGFRLAGLFLTHAHIGHYSGLVQLGPEVWNTHLLPVFASDRMGDFLRGNQPWKQLIDRENIQLNPLEPLKSVDLTPEVQVIPRPVPHRDEWSDTLAFEIRGPERNLIYCPDIDGWEGEDSLLEVIASADVALLDGTFFSPEEIPGRDLTEIPHPLILDTITRFGGSLAEIHLIHMNHTNPVLRPGPERDRVEQAGFQVGRRGALWAL